MIKEISKVFLDFYSEFEKLKRFLKSYVNGGGMNDVQSYRETESKTTRVMNSLKTKIINFGIFNQDKDD